MQCRQERDALRMRWTPATPMTWTPGTEPPRARPSSTCSTSQVSPAHDDDASLRAEQKTNYNSYHTSVIISETFMIQSSRRLLCVMSTTTTTWTPWRRGRASPTWRWSTSPPAAIKTVRWCFRIHFPKSFSITTFNLTSTSMQDLRSCSPSTPSHTGHSKLSNDSQSPDDSINFSYSELVGDKDEDK